MKPLEERLRWRPALTAAEVDASIRSLVWMATRLSAVCLPLAWVAAGPLCDWIAFADARPVPTTHRVSLAAFCLVLPTMLFWSAASLAWRRPTQGRVVRLDDVAMRCGDRSHWWRHLTAVAVDRDVGGRPRRLQLLTNDGRTVDVGLPADAALAGDAVSFVSARVPTYDAATHGPLDVSSALPTWAIFALAIACSVIIAWAYRLSVTVPRPTRMHGRLLALASLIVPIAWSIAVRPYLTKQQRGAAFGVVILFVMATTTGVGVALWTPRFRGVADELRSIPAAERARTFAMIRGTPRD